jgi:hypothetical protein
MRKRFISLMKFIALWSHEERQVSEAQGQRGYYVLHGGAARAGRILMGAATQRRQLDAMASRV